MQSWLCQYVREKMVLRGAPSSELRFGVDGRIDLAAELFARLAQRQRELRGRHVADDHQVDVAVRTRLAAGHGAVHEGALDLDGKGLQGVSKYVHETGRFQQEAAEIREDRRLGVCLEIGHPPLPVGLEDASVAKGMEFTLQAGRRYAHPTGQFRDVPDLFGLNEQSRQYSLAGLRDESIEDRHVTHIT